MKRKAILLVLVAALLMFQSASAMSSAHYRLDWVVPLTGGAGGSAASAHYMVSLTVGQSANGVTDSTNYKAGLGFWYFADRGGHLFLPLMTIH